MAGASPPLAFAASAERPNVLMIAIDDLNDWIAPMAGHPQALTPNFDRLAKRSTLFMNAHVQAYLACVAFVDHQLGRILDALESSPYNDNTIIVLWSDHGYHLGEKNIVAKMSLWEESSRAPLFIGGPGLNG
ncbi:sulfatase-like hydrolase/transferase, partial [Arthrospira platensis SPKY1]|nr:sulfatase-like hydrolase/transferase [Arthrospira platensis SPKY1]